MEIGKFKPHVERMLHAYANFKISNKENGLRFGQQEVDYFKHLSEVFEINQSFKFLASRYENSRPYKFYTELTLLVKYFDEGKISREDYEYSLIFITSLLHTMDILPSVDVSNIDTDIPMVTLNMSRVTSTDAAIRLYHVDMGKLSNSRIFLEDTELDEFIKFMYPKDVLADDLTIQTYWIAKGITSALVVSQHEVDYLSSLYKDGWELVDTFPEYHKLYLEIKDYLSGFARADVVERKGYFHEEFHTLESYVNMEILDVRALLGAIFYYIENSKDVPDGKVKIKYNLGHDEWIISLEDPIINKSFEVRIYDDLVCSPDIASMLRLFATLDIIKDITMEEGGVETYELYPRFE